MEGPIRSVLLWAVVQRMLKLQEEGKSQTEIARRCDICQGTVSRWMNSDCISGSAIKLERALRALGGRVHIVPAKPVKLDRPKLRVVA